MRREAARWVALGALLLAVFLWSLFWVSPRDQFLHDIMDCMGDENSQEAYDRCEAKLTAEAQ